MVTKYVILADSKNDLFKVPRQLTKINGEPIIKRTVRLLKENGIKDITITSHDKRFDNLGAKRYEPKFNEYAKGNGGYWLDAFPIELLNQPITFMFGDVYYSEEAIKKIVETDTKTHLFFCTYQNKSDKYIKQHDEPLAYKIVNYELFKEHINIVKNMKDKGMCCREPLVWEVYRSMNGLYINEHKMSNNYIAINDISCDIDGINDITKLLIQLGGIEMIKVKVIEGFTLEKFNELKNIKRTGKDIKGFLNVGDEFECTKEMADYLSGNNPLNKKVIQIIEVIPAKEEKKEDKIEVSSEEVKPKTEFKTSKKKKNSKK